MGSSESGNQLGRYVASIAIIATAIAFTGKASAFIDAPVLSTQNAAVGEEIYVNIRNGECDGFTSSAPQISQSENSVRLLLESVHYGDPVLCNVPVSTARFSLPALPEGNYTLAVERFYETPSSKIVYETLGNYSIIVRGDPQAIPLFSSSIAGMLVLFIGSLVLAWRRIIYRTNTLRAMAMLVLVALPLGASAQSLDHTLEVLLSGAQGMPTPEDVVDWAHAPAGREPPLQSFNDIAPSSVTFALSYRANPELRIWIDANPGSDRAILERYILVKYPSYVDAELARQSLTQDAAVEVAYPTRWFDLSSVGLDDFSIGQDEIEAPSGVGYEWGTLNLEAAWNRAGGHALVGAVDSGLYVNHPALRQFSATGQHINGNFIPAASLDVGRGFSALDYNVDEQEPEPITDPVCNPGGLPGVPPSNAGHGSHISGLIGANVNSALGLRGACKNCGIAMARIVRGVCLANGTVSTSGIQYNVIADAINWLTDSGVQVINLSLGNPEETPANYCPTHSSTLICSAISFAKSRGVAIVGASGNWRVYVQFPAADERITAVGGYDSGLVFWDESPPLGNYVNCPYGNNRECGSNYTFTAGGPRQEVVAGSKSVLSSMYPGKNWNATISCGDAYGTPIGDGVGSCTGTSMSSALISGLVGILRSSNPLVQPSIPVPTSGQLPGIRTVLANTTFQAQSSIPWNNKFGYGRPDANAAVQMMLGRVAGNVVKNRVTPLFRLYGSSAKDYAETTSPQFAHAVLNSVGGYASQGSVVPGYSAFDGAAPPSAPRAGAYVLTTEFRPQPSWPALVPLYMADRGRYFPKGCPSNEPGCVITGQDFTLLTTAAHIEHARIAGYNLRAIQGYIYQTCSPEPLCIPPGAEKFYRACKSADSDCATFLESERTLFESLGYITAFPTGSSKILGYAYPPTDSDGDGLVDGFEYVIGTSIYLTDSDGDGQCPTSTTGLCDAREFPMAGLSLSDPCDGPSAGSCPARDVIFTHGFE